MLAQTIQADALGFPLELSWPAQRTVTPTAESYHVAPAFFN